MQREVVAILGECLPCFPTEERGNFKKVHTSNTAGDKPAESSNARGGIFMATCEVCGNEYDKSFELIAAGARHTFDSFECAIQAIAPICEHCKCRVIGHGVEVGGRFFCCAHCARSATSADVKDRAA